MFECQYINEAVLAILESLRIIGLSSRTVSEYNFVYKSFIKYLTENKIDKINVGVCLDYICVKTDQRFDSFECVASSHRVNYYMRPLNILMRYLTEGSFNNERRSQRPNFICPPNFEIEYEAFCDEMVCRGLKTQTIRSNTRTIQFLIIYLYDLGINTFDMINSKHIESYLHTLKDRSLQYIKRIIYVFRLFFSILYERGHMSYNFVPLLPKVRLSKNAKIPYVWSKDDIQRLLNAIDREDPLGKRDYAIILIAVRLGLRIGDIRALNQSSINWTKNVISYMCQKTGKSLELPLLKDIGWAIIDYLQNGRPTSKSERLFLSHKPPFNAFGGTNNFYGSLHKYIIKAGINMPNNERHGVHSLRNTLAGLMLQSMSPLPIISEVLGHQSINTTSKYLKIDIEALRKCALDPEDIFNET